MSIDFTINADAMLIKAHCDVQVISRPSTHAAHTHKCSCKVYKHDNAGFTA